MKIIIISLFFLSCVHICTAFNGLFKLPSSSIPTLRKSDVNLLNEIELLKRIDEIRNDNKLQFSQANIPGCWQVLRTINEPNWTKYSQVLSQKKSICITGVFFFK